MHIQMNTAFNEKLNEIQQVPNQSKYVLTA
jgi:hypothetical protein